jgi:site-specific DNA recombinase
VAARTLRLDAAIRVSQRDGREGEEFRSPEQQREICLRCAESNSAEIVAWHHAIDVSGKTMKRDDIDAALERMRSGQTDGLVVAWLDRFSRAPVGEALRAYDDISAAGGKVIAADMAGIDPRDPTGELALTVMLGVNRMQWRRIADRWEMTRSDAIKAGKAIGGAPYGYRFADPTPRTRGRGVVDSRLVPDERTAPLLRELFTRRTDGATWLELARWLDKVDPKPPPAHWRRSTVAGIISRRTYLGEVRSGPFVNAGAHEPLVTPALWRQAQRPPGRRTPRGTYLLTGLVRCSGCGRRMRSTTGGRGSKPATYSCQTAGCELRYTTVTVERLDAEVTDQFFAHLDAFHVQPVNDGDIEAARAAVEIRGGELDRLAAVIPAHPRAVEAHQAALRDAEQALAEAEDRLTQLVASTANADAARELRSDWPGLTLEERREILRAGIDTVLVRRALRRTAHLPIRNRILVLFRGDAPDGLRDNGRSGPIRSWTWNDDIRSLAPAA